MIAQKPGNSRLFLLLNFAACEKLISHYRND